MESPHVHETLKAPCHGRVLVVDDSPEGRSALSRVLELQGFQVHSVASGGEALKALQSAEPPRVLITDLVLPDLDGREVARATATLSPRPWVVLTTGWGFEADAAELARDNIDLLMPKPLDIRQLCLRLDQVIARDAAEP